MREYKDLLQLLFDENVKFLVVGGYAVVAHGYARTTDDIDIWIEPTLENAEKTIRAVRRYDVTTSELQPERVADPYSFFRIGTDQGLKIDIMSHPGSDLEFNEAWPGRFITEFEGMEIPFIGLRDLFRIKKAVGRHRDLDDLENLRAFHRLPDED